MMKKLDQILKKNRVRLNENGEVDWSGCEDRKIIDKYHGNPYV